MRTSPRPPLSALLAAALAAATSPAAAQSRAEPARVQVTVSGAAYLAVGERISAVSVAAKDIAEVAAFPPDQLLITGKHVGQTTATVWHGDKNVELLLIEVTYPLEAIRAALRRSLPDATELDVAQAGAAIVLSGQVASVADVERAEAIVRGYARGDLGDATIINLLTLVGDQQVQLEVAFAEVSRSGLREIGFNFWARKTDYAGGLVAPTQNLDTISPQVSTTPKVSDLGATALDAVPLVGAPLSGAFGAVFSTTLGGFPFSAALSILANKGFARVLAEPTLTALSGENAAFLAGGEFPIPLPQSLGQIGVEYKKFGIQLDFTPTVVGDTIQLQTGVTVSDIDFSLGVKLATVTVPGLTSRHASTTVRVRDGQSFVIAGLLSDRVRSSSDAIPGLGELPILGALFRSSSYRREETELLVVVTAHRVRPLDERPAVPGEDRTTDPSDLELFLLGRSESLRTDRPRPAAAPAGAIGFQR
jgi:pilus assembly protein CpaC